MEQWKKKRILERVIQIRHRADKLRQMLDSNNYNEEEIVEELAMADKEVWAAYKDARGGW